ncbi:hypothetical protein KCU71_g22022, partial [Aureobasidium melanogenum]
PTDAVVFGTSIVADVELSPIRKGIKLGKIEMRLIEAVTKRIQSSEVPDQRGDRCKVDESDVAKAEMEFPEESRVIFGEESVDNPIMEDEKYVFKATLELPKSLKQCRQDVDSHNINITHRFKLMVNIHNPEGHISQLVCRLPVKLFISPNLPVDDSNEVQVAARTMTDAELNQQEVTLNAPPEYGRHQLDALYNDINTGGYMSRAPSGSATPFYAQSRNASSENLQSLNGVADMHHSQSMPALGGGESHFVPAQLRSRLANLQDQGSSRQIRAAPVAHHSPSGGNTPAYTGGYFAAHFAQSHSGHASPPHQSPAHSVPESRRASGDGEDLIDDNVPHLDDFDMGTLSRVPSYGAAVRTPGPFTPFADGLPSYMEATSRPPSPTLQLPQRPGAAHVRSGISTPGSHSSTQTLTGAVTPGSFAPNGLTPLTQLHPHEDNRLRLLRARVD